MISDTTDAHEFGTEVAADRSDVSVHARPYFAVQPWFATAGAKDDVKDDLAERLRHGGMMIKRVLEVNRAFSANEFFLTKTPGALPQAIGECCAFGAKQIRMPVLR